MKQALIFTCLLVTLSAFLPVPSLASEPASLGAFGKWHTYMFEENGGKVCYMVANPEKSEGKYAKRGEVAVMITHRPSEKTRDVFSYMSGYGYKKDSKVEVVVDGKTFKLFTQNDMAWGSDATADRALSAAIQKGNKMVVKGESSRGTKTVDSYSLAGSSKSYAAISKACGY